MEAIEAGVPQRDEGAGASGTGAHLKEPFEVSIGQFADHDPAQGAWIDASIAEAESVKAVEPNPAQAPNGEPSPKPDLSPRGIRKLRGQYFTVRHIPLADCGHKMDVINEPRHRNCENCWFQWLNFHPQLVSTVDEAWREHGKEFVVRMRGNKFVEMYGRFMATVAHLRKEEEAQNANKTIGGISEGNGEAGDISTVNPLDQSGEDQGSTGGGEGAQ